MSGHVGKKKSESIVGMLRDAVVVERCIVELKRLGIAEQNIFVAQKAPPLEREAIGETDTPRSLQRGGVSGVPNALGLGENLADQIVDMGFARDTAQRYAELVEAENILLAVHCEGLCEQVITVLDKRGAFDVRRSGIAADSLEETYGI